MTNEPSLVSLGGAAPKAVFRRLFLATRPKFLTASVLPVLLGTAYGAGLGGGWNIPAFLLTLLAMMCVHGGINVLNDVYDEKSGNDRANQARIHPYSGGSRFIQNGVLTLKDMMALGWGLLGAGGIIGVGLAALVGWDVMWFGVAGVALGVFYSVPPIWLSGRGLGEVAVAAGFGVLPVVGAAWVQAGVLDMGAALLSVPVSLWITNVLLINEVPDRAADASVGRKTLAVMMGARGTAWLYVVLAFGTVASCLVAGVFGVVPYWAAVVPVALLVLVRRGFHGIRLGDHDVLRLGIEATLAQHALGTVWLVLVVLSAGY